MKLFLHHGGLSFVSENCVGEEVTCINDLDPNYINVMHVLKLIKTKLKYNNIKKLWCKFGSESFEYELSVLESDVDVWRVIDQI